MAGLNRKLRRQMAKEKIADTMTDDQRLEEMYRHASVAAYQNILAAAVLTVMYDFKLIQKRETRLDNFLGCINQKLAKINSDEPMPELVELKAEMDKILKAGEKC